jgi:putative hydrolase of the HAD superfamily
MPLDPRVNAVLFDFGGTLDADGEPSGAQFFRAYHASGGSLTAAAFDPVFRESDRLLADHPSIRRLGFRDTILTQSRLLAELLPDAEEIAIATAVHDPAVAIASRNAGILRVLRDRGIRIGVVSNFTGNLDRCLRELGLAPLIDAVLDSAVAGVRKPVPEIFTRALDQLGVPAERALMVGDNPFADIMAAAEAGMATCWLAPLTRAVPPGCAPTFRITRLTDLVCTD